MQRIIVTADDYGMCDEVDRAIEAGIENGFITTTNVMLNMETFSDAADFRTRYPSLSVAFIGMLLPESQSVIRKRFRL